jgi:4-amino-4-deoxy-L-arabinose transferase-like glycosyltransferase
LVVVGFFIRAQKLQRNLWYDEAHSLLNARGADIVAKIAVNGPEFTSGVFLQKGSWGDTLSAVAHTEDTPPLYFLLLRVWMNIFGDSDTALRMFSVVTGALTIPAMFVFVRKLFDQRIGFIAAGILTILPVHVQYSQEARAYALILLLSILASWAVWSAYQTIGTRDERRYWVYYVLFATACLYAHYYSVGVLIAHGLFALAQPKGTRLALVKRMALAAAAVSALFVPWLLSPYFDAQWSPWWRGKQLVDAGLRTPREFWTPGTFRYLLNLPRDLATGWLFRFLGNPMYGIIPMTLYTATVIGLVLVGRGKGRRSPIGFCFSLILIPTLFVIATAAAARSTLPIHCPKYILPVLAGLVPLFSVVITSGWNRGVGIINAILIAGLFVNFEAAILESKSGMAHPGWHGFFANISRAVEVTSQKAGPDEMILIASDHARLAVTWNVYQKRPVPERLIAHKSGSLYGKKRVAPEPPWSEIENKYRGLYLVLSQGLPSDVVLARLKSSYGLVGVDRFGPISVHHYVKYFSESEPETKIVEEMTRARDFMNRKLRRRQLKEKMRK